MMTKIRLKGQLVFFEPLKPVIQHESVLEMTDTILIETFLMFDLLAVFMHDRSKMIAIVKIKLCKGIQVLFRLIDVSEQCGKYASTGINE
jgi:hypothetical protein